VNHSKYAAILRAAADLIDRTGCWTKGEDARDDLGLSVPAWSSRACAWCAIGALRRCGDGSNAQVSSIQQFMEARVLSGETLAQFNDVQAERRPVVRALRRAARIAEKMACHVAAAIKENS
jgi:hypothetical protein